MLKATGYTIGAIMLGILVVLLGAAFLLGRCSCP